MKRERLKHIIIEKTGIINNDFSGSTTLTMELFRQLDEFMGPELIPVVASIADYCAKQPPNSTTPSDYTPRFIYFNKLNLACKSTVHTDGKPNGGVSCPPESLWLMADIKSQRHRLGNTGETILKTMNDYWVVGKMSNEREFYVALQQKNASLIDISGEQSLGLKIHF